MDGFLVGYIWICIQFVLGLMLDLLAPPCANVHSPKLGVNHYGLARKLEAS